MQTRRSPAALPLDVVLTACLYSAAAKGEVQLLPAGEFAARDGRPGKGRKWRLNDDQGAALAAKLNARTVALPLDYEHQTLNSESNGQPAPAAGWATRFEWRPGVGLFALDVQWTDRARQMIEAGEYRYISPVFVASKASGVVLDVLHAALVNFPALTGMAEVAERIAARLAGTGTTPTEERHSMTIDVTALLDALGIAADATEDAAIAACAALRARAEQAEALSTEVAALKANAGKPDATQVAAMRALQTEVAELRTAQRTREVDDVVTAALASGRLLPAQEKWARELGASNIEALRGYVASAPQIAALAGTQTKGKGEDKGGESNEAVALKARAYIDEQAKHGITVSAAAAVRHVTRGA